MLLNTVLAIVILFMAFNLYTMHTSIERLNGLIEQCHAYNIQTTIQRPVVQVRDDARDRAVLSDPLYPPVNRQSDPMVDTYRLVGYLVNVQDPKDSWKLFARSKNRHQAVFYASSTNVNIDLKIAISDEIVAHPSQRLRDLYNLPETVTLNHPLFASTPYSVIINANGEAPYF